jgi:hypothetical protein
MKKDIKRIASKIFDYLYNKYVLEDVVLSKGKRKLLTALDDLSI